MYLALLNSDEKEMFLGLAYNLATVDGDYSDEEKNVIIGYCQEMQCEFDEKTMIKPNEHILNKINAISDKRAKKIVIFELIGLAMADGKYDDNERELLKKLAEGFNIELSFLKKCENELDRYIEFQVQLNKLVLE